MREQLDNAVEIIKNQDINGCISGSYWLDYFEGQDVDVFCYDLASTNKLLYELNSHPMFQIVDELEQWKFDRWLNNSEDWFNKKSALLSIKFKYNTCIDVNVVFKRDCTNIFEVLSKFDMDIVAKGYDIQSKRFLDLGLHDGKNAHINPWNPNFRNNEYFNNMKLLRQINRVIKYYRRGYNTDAIAYRYIEILDYYIKYVSFFKSENFNNNLLFVQSCSVIIREVLYTWLENHTDENDEIIELVNDLILLLTNKSLETSRINLVHNHAFSILKSKNNLNDSEQELKRKLKEYA